MCFRRKKKNKLDRTIICKVSPVIYYGCMALVAIFAAAVTVVVLVEKVNFLWYLMILPAVLGIILVFYCDGITKHTKLMFDQGKLILHQGIISSHQTELPAVNVISITIEKGLFSRLFKYGNIKIVTANEQYYFKKMKDPDKFISETSEYLVSITRK